jgi:choline/carnitine/betaine transport
MNTNPTENLAVATAKGGFYKGFNHTVTLCSKALILALALWALVFPDKAVSVLSAVQGMTLDNFGSYYIYAMAMFAFVCFILAAIPKIGKIKLGSADTKPEFSSFSWFSMMFGAGIGIGMLTYATGEPIYHFANNPDIITGTVAAKSEEALESVYRYSFLHWGVSAWSVYSLVGLSLAYFSYNRGQPLTIRSGLAPLFGNSLNGVLGHVVDITAVLATILGIAVTIGFGISQFASGIYNVFGAQWMIESGKPSTISMLAALVIVMGLSTLSAISGVGKGIKWLSNINMTLSFALLAFFLVFGSMWLALELLGKGIVDYLFSFVSLAVNVEAKDTPLGDWQGGWTIFYWAWWIAYAPFVGMFFARISKGRTIREFILGSIFVPSLVCFIWFTFVGGTALDLELSGQANGQILNADISAQIFQVLNLLLSPIAAKLMSVVVVVLLLTFLITSADSAVLVVNTINAGGNTERHSKVHITIWGAFLTIMIAALLLAGGLGALKTAMVIGALPFSFIMVLMTVALLKEMFGSPVEEGNEQTQGSTRNM